MTRGLARPLAFAWALGPGLACRVGPCPEAPQPTSPPVVAAPPVEPPAAPVETCTLTRAEAGARATAALATLAGLAVDAPPPGFAARPCVSHCLPERGKLGDDAPCGSWECPYVYGPPALHFPRVANLTVHVLRCGAQVLPMERLADCFAKAHRCRLVVDRTAAGALAEARGALEWFEPALRWVPSAGEFHWLADFDDGPSLRISAHEHGKTWDGPVPPRPPYSVESGPGSVAP